MAVMFWIDFRVIPSRPISCVCLSSDAAANTNIMYMAHFL